MTRFILAMLVAFFSSSVFAAFPAGNAHYHSVRGGSSSFTFPTAEAACADVVSRYNTQVPSGGAVVTGVSGLTCNWGVNSGGVFYPESPATIFVIASAYCPSNSTLGGGNCTCSASYVEEGSTCVLPSVCDVGQGRTFNRTEGWARSSNADADDLVSSIPPLTSLEVNDGQCLGALTGVQRCFRSQQPTAQGLYRLSCDYTMVMTGDAPPGSNVPETDPTTENATCPGFVGEVNGKTVCVGTASSPLPPAQPAPNKPTAPGNPSAGVKPLTGEGSGSDGPGRTPIMGVGGNSGGPSAAAVGAGGTGDRDSDGEDPAGAVCGALPLPPCAVKVDETGTPAEGTAEGRFGQANTDLAKVQTDALGAFGDIEDISLPSWTWTFQFPTGCTPLVLPAFDDFEIDVCQFQPIIHDLMSVIWVIAGIWGLIALFRNATGV